MARIDGKNRKSNGAGLAILINEDYFLITYILDLTSDMINLEVVLEKCVRIDGAVYTVANIYNNNRQNFIKDDPDLVYQSWRELRSCVGIEMAILFCGNPMVVKIGQNRIFTFGLNNIGINILKVLLDLIALK